jgi:DNA repair protein RecO (recombination protein O)
MEWSAESIVLSARSHGETAAIVQVITPDHGRHAGMVAGGQGRAMRPVLQAGSRVMAHWRGRMADQLGYFTFDPMMNHAARWFDNPTLLAMVASACAVTECALPERQPMAGVYAALSALLSLTDEALWPPAYVQWEIGLLSALGYGLDLTSCAATGAIDDLCYVSPRTGRAVSRTAGEPYHDKMLKLPAFLKERSEWDDTAIYDGLCLTGHFLSRHVFAHPQSRTHIIGEGEAPLPRQRLQALYHRTTHEKSGA